MKNKQQRHSCQISRGDLIRAMAHYEQTDLPDEVIQTLGFMRLDSPDDHLLQQLSDTLANLPKADDITDPKQDDEQNPPPEPQPEPEPEHYSWSFLVQDTIEYLTTPDQKKDTGPDLFPGVKALTADDLKAEDQERIDSPLLSKSRQHDFIRQFLRHELGRRLDLKKLTRQIALAQPLYRLPYKRHSVPASRLYVLADASKRLIYQHCDTGWMCAEIIKVLGETGLEIRQFWDLPGQDYELWPLRKNQHQNLNHDHWTPLDSTSEVLILSDMGQLSDNNSSLRRYWLHFLQRLNQQGFKPIALSPVPASQQCPKVQKRVRQVLWQHKGPLTENPGIKHRQHTQAQVDKVLSLLSIATHIEPELLREAIKQLGLPSGIEGLIYHHQAIQFGYTAIAFKAESVQHYRERFILQPETEQKQIIDLIDQYHQPLFKGVRAETFIHLDTLLAQNSPIGLSLQQYYADQISWAKEYMQRLAVTAQHTLQQPNQSLASYASRHLGRLSEQTKKSKDYQTYTSVLYAVAERDRIQAGAELPEHIDPTVLQALSQPYEPLHLVVRQEGEAIWLRKEQLHYQDSPLTTGVTLADFYCNSASILLTAGQHHRQISLQDFSDQPLPVIQSDHSFEPFTLTLTEEKRCFTPLPKPNWACSLYYCGNVLQADLILQGYRHTLAYDYFIQKSPIQQRRRWQIAATKETTNSDVAVGHDDYGLFADLTLMGIVQRFRWIEPGTFLMGSPKGEPERHYNETQHPVTLTQGYWLADTCVTQALWQAVMGDNPSEFKGDKHPVDSVSWQDCWRFILVLKEQYPSLRLTLPTEAQWEYACRAGTTTPFSFGDNIDSTLVNFGGTEPYNQGEKSEYRRETVPVKSLPENPWGLYEMHGNLWEWCQDTGIRSYDEAATDPGQPFLYQSGSEGAYMHPLRGGGWIGDGRFCRSAYRYHDQADFRYDYFGFRLSLGHEQQEGGADGPQARTKTGEQRGAASQSVAPRSGQKSEKTGLKQSFDSVKTNQPTGKPDAKSITQSILDRLLRRK